MIPEDKLSVIRTYLRTEFPDFELDDRYDFDRIAWTFRLNAGQKTHLVTVLRKFIDDHTFSGAPMIFQDSHLKQYFNNEKVTRVLVTTKGIGTENSSMSGTSLTNQSGRRSITAPMISGLPSTSTNNLQPHALYRSNWGTGSYFLFKEKPRRTDWLIDQIVYRLYGLTEEEVKIVEGKGWTKIY